MDWREHAGFGDVLWPRVVRSHLAQAPAEYYDASAAPAADAHSGGSALHHWFAAQDLGDPAWLQYLLILLGFTLGLIADDLWRHWQFGVAHALHFEDVIDGTCPDAEHEICEAAVWRWYEKRGKPWWISRKRERPQVRPVEVWRRMDAYQRAMKAEETRLRRKHGV